MGVSRSKKMPHFLLGSSFFNFLRVIRRYGGGSRSHWLRTCGIGMFSLLTSPFRVYESLRHNHTIRKVELHPEPVFLIGHWQSGHSPLHLLFGRDERFGYLDAVQSAFPGSFVCSEWWLRSLMDRLLRGKDRGSDSMKLTTRLPQGSDLPMAALCEFSTYHSYVFPSQAETVFTRGVVLDRVTERELNSWKDSYRFLMQKIAYSTGKTRLLVRNASDTARIPHLLSLFPDAKFVYISRDPYAMIQATNDRWESMCRLWSLQDYELPVLHEQSLDFCERLIGKYLTDRSLIPADNLTQVRFEDLNDDPVETMRQLYEDLALDGFGDAEPEFSAAAESAAGTLAGSTDSLDEAFKDSVRNRLRFVFDEFDYTP
jgi:hypothetical protein